MEDLVVVGTLAEDLLVVGTLVELMDTPLPVKTKALLETESWTWLFWTKSETSLTKITRNKAKHQHRATELLPLLPAMAVIFF